MIQARKQKQHYFTKPQRYEQAKQAYMMRHPHATSKEYEAFIRGLIKRLRM